MGCRDKPGNDKWGSGHGENKVKTVITSLQNPTIKLIRSLAEKKYRQQAGLFVAEGEKVLARARAEGWQPDYLVSTGHMESWGTAQRIVVNDKVIASLTAQKNAPSAIGVFKQRWLAKAEPRGLWLALENLRDPGNLGTIIRTADAVAASGVILAGQSCDPWATDCVRATMGSIFGVPLLRMDTPTLIELCRGWPGEVAGTHVQATEDYRRRYASPTLLAMGSEASGLSDDLAAACPVLVGIPMRGAVESLNVAVAAALVLFEVRRHEGPAAAARPS